MIINPLQCFHKQAISFEGKSRTSKRISFSLYPPPDNILFRRSSEMMQVKYYIVFIAHIIANHFLFKLFKFLFNDYLSGFYLCLMNVVGFLLILNFTFEFTKRRFLKDKIDPKNKAVFVTGCDTGFGHLLVKKLDAKGFHVFAGCLFPEGTGAQVLQKWCSQRLTIVPLDVTKEESVRNAAEVVRESADADLWAIVNNAGIQSGFSIDLTDVEEFKEVMDVNAFGPVRVTKAFLPLLKQTKGRVVNITSVAGRSAIPHAAPYIISKHAALAFSACLRQEMSEWGVSVVAVEPELFQTQLTNMDRVRERLSATFSSLKESTKADYGDKYLADFGESTELFARYASPKVGLVVRDLEMAVTLKYPSNHYRPRRSLWYRFICFFYEKCPSSVQDIIVNVCLSLIHFPKPAGLKK